MEGSHPSSKKMKLAVPRSHGVPPPPEAAGGVASPPCPHDQQRLPGDGADRISDLTDAILSEIVSLLPTKQAVRTQILSPRWRRIWSSAPLNLHCEGLLPADAGEDVLAGVVSRTVSAHPGPGRRFCVPSSFLRDRAAAVDAWLWSPALDSLQELEFWVKPYVRPGPLPRPLQQPPPPSTFRFSATLRVLTVGNCTLPDSTVRGLHFPRLKRLGLELVTVSELSLHGMIAGCPALECLLINHGFGFRCLRISSLTLRSVCVNNYRMCNDDQLKELVVENAPCLQSLLYFDLDYGLRVSVVSAPKQETIGCLCDGLYISQGNELPILMFGSTVIQALRVDSLTAAMCTVKILAVYMERLSLDTVLGLMRCFPCLEKVCIEHFIKYVDNEWDQKHRNLIACLDIRLKTVVFDWYLGTKSDINFASFFILNARALELMTFQLEPKDYNDKFLAGQRRKLQLQKRASRDARFHFTTDSVRGVSDIHHVRDLDLTDPFVC